MTHRIGLISVALICGGPSLERGISLNSARSVLDHLSRDGVEIVPYYVDVYKNYYRLDRSAMYSNTPSDFDFKLHQTAKKLPEDDFWQELRQHDIVFPVIHGPYGEDGELQEELEKRGLPFVGSDSKACRICFGKHTASAELARNGYATLPSKVLEKGSLENEQIIREFFADHKLTRAIIKPVYGGSSIGVISAYTPEEAFEKLNRLFQGPFREKMLLEPFCFGREFTVIVLQGKEGHPVALVPTEIQVQYDNNGIFDYRRKYLPSANTIWFCPPHFPDNTIKTIQNHAEDLFSLFHLRDFARLDGWVLDDGRILFTDFNPISGMEQNSFIFQQSSRIGLTHGDLLWGILTNALRREQIPFSEPSFVEEKEKKPVHVLFGGTTAERQVSLMTGTNVWLKLKKSSEYSPEPFLLTEGGTVWHLPYTFSLSHTVEEIREHCLVSDEVATRMEPFLVDIRNRLPYARHGYSLKDNLPRKMSFQEFIAHSRENKSYVFIGLHGGEGENGTIQRQLQEAGLSFNGSDPVASELCMDKYLTGLRVKDMRHDLILSIPKKLIHLPDFREWSHLQFDRYWDSLKTELEMESCVIKPRADGCSAGIVRLNSATDLKKYIDFVEQRVSYIPVGSFFNQQTIIEMPQEYCADFILERFIETDYIRIVKNELIYRPVTGWIELTVGVIEKNSVYHALSPSITVAEGEILSVEEKFQGGTGVNLTPPPQSIISTEQVLIIKGYIEQVSATLGIRGYARLDIFFNVRSNAMYVIEANSLPALTPSTVLYHQALAEEAPLFPKEFLESLVKLT